MLSSLKKLAYSNADFGMRIAELKPLENKSSKCGFWPPAQKALWLGEIAELKTKNSLAHPSFVPPCWTTEDR